MGCEAKTEFKIATMANREADIMYALEDTSFMNRLLCGNTRPWEMNVHGGSDGNAPQIAKFVRPYRLLPAPCKLCCHQEVQHLDAAGNPLGKTVESFWLFVPKYVIKDQNGQDEFIFSQPTCVGGMCVNIFAEGLFNCRIPFYVFPPGVEQEKGNEVGSIVKIFGGLSTELFTDADKFEMKFPPGAKSDTKARMLGSLFLLNQLYFEGGNQGAAGA